MSLAALHRGGAGFGARARARLAALGDLLLVLGDHHPVDLDSGGWTMWGSVASAGTISSTSATVTFPASAIGGFGVAGGHPVDEVALLVSPTTP